MTYTTIDIERASGVARLWLNRPDLRNAMNDVMIAELNEAIAALVADDAVRVIVLGGRGKVFCAGGDLAWMKTARDMTPEEARKDSGKLARVLRQLYESPKPTVARVHGAAFAGGMGLVSACDIAVASEETRFCLSEVKLGLIPAMISPYVIRAMGEPRARRYFLTAEVFDAVEAHRIGFVHELAPAETLDERVDALVAHLVQGGPLALAACKRLIRDVAGRPIDDAITDETAARVSRVRASDEAQEGIAAFFEKRKPNWVGKEHQ